MNIISFFAGAGGDQGFKDAGFNIIWAKIPSENLLMKRLF